ncbi:hypothetical protein KCP70_06625 [Salmonella enterica subsp. enterica]|nr:hypothetical protein KCP70_06625 [Salmonella enterica subsp. enterica]
MTLRSALPHRAYWRRTFRILTCAELFCIPRRRWPSMGPIGVAHLAPFVPGHSVVQN